MSATITVPSGLLWLNSTQNTADSLGLILNAYTYTATPGYTVTEWANGAMRATSTKGIPITAKANVGFISDADTAWLLAHLGTTVWVRDYYGNRFVAPVPTIAATPYAVPNLWDVTLNFSGISHTDAV